MANGVAASQRSSSEIGAMMYFWVMLGSALGGGARYLFSGLAAHNFGETFPWGTLIVNVTGSFIIGFFSTLTGPDGRVFVGSEGRQFVMTGICRPSISSATAKWRSRAPISACRSFSASSPSGAAISRPSA